MISHYCLILCLLIGANAFSMSMRDAGITNDIHSVASSLNDILKESFESMTGSLGKHGVYYIPELKYDYEYQQTQQDEKKKVEFHASNGWMKYPTMKFSENISSGALRKYKVPVSSSLREIVLVCVNCLEISAEAVNYCYEATYNGKNVSGTITSGPVLYMLSLEMRITQTLRNRRDNDVLPSCNVVIGERNLELSDQSNFRSEVRGLRSLNFLADNIDAWIRDDFNSTVKVQLEKKLLTSLSKVFTKHNMCEEFIGKA